MFENRIATLSIREYLARQIRADRVPRAILVHGALDRSISFTRMAKLLNELGIDCIAYDRRGYQDSTLSEPFSLNDLPTIDDHVEDLAEIIGTKPAIVFGHSLGGTIALLLAEQNRSPIKALVTFESPVPWMDFWRKSANYGMELEDLAEPKIAQDHAEQFMIRMIGQDRWDKLPLSTRERRRNEGLILVSEMATATNRMPPLDPSRISIPCIIARGMQAGERYGIAVDYLAAAIPRATQVLVDHTDHGIHLTNPTEAVRLLEKVYERLPFE